MKKIIISLSIIGVVAAVVIVGTIAYFSDTETSVGNTFTAGAIDLKIDNESYVTNPETGELMYSSNTSWELNDLTEQLFFNFVDLKPGDIGEDTISLHVNNNDAWACMSIALTGIPENGQSEPEAEVDTSAGDQEGELQDELYFAFWADDGDNVYEDDEVKFAEGLAADLFDGQNWTLADSTKNIWTGTGPIEGGENDLPVYYIGKVWCYGDLTEAAVSQGEDTSPIERGTGFICDGAEVGNESQTDGIIADVEFYAEQSRNNPNFTCVQPEIIQVTSSTMNFSSTGWAGWSCPSTHPNIVTGGTNCSPPLTYSLAWELGASVPGYNYPETPFGYTYTSPTEEGWIVQNGGVGQSCEIIINCQAN